MHIYAILIMDHYKRRFLLFFFATNKAQKKTAAAALDGLKKRRQQPPQPPPPEIKHAYIIGISILSRFQMKAKNEVTGQNRIQDRPKTDIRIIDTIYILICTIYI